MTIDNNIVTPEQIKKELEYNREKVVSIEKDIKESKEYIKKASFNLEKIKERLKTWEDVKARETVYYLTDEELSIVKKTYD